MNDDEILEEGGADLSEDIGDSAFPFGCSLRQKRFTEFYLQCGNGTEAAKRAGYSGNRKALSVRSAQLLKTPKVIQYLAHLMMPEGRKLTREYLQEQLHREALTGSNPTARTKALEILGRYAGLDVNRVQVDIFDHKSMDDLFADVRRVKLQEFDLRGSAFVEAELLELLLIVGRRDVIEEALKSLPVNTSGQLLEHQP